MWLFKLLGLLLVFSGCFLGGMLMSEKLRLRTLKLEALVKSFSHLASLLKVGGYEVAELCGKCFNNSLITVKNGVFKVETKNLTSEDISILEDFVSDFGMLEPEGEHNRANIYSRLIDEQYSKAKDEYRSLSRLYRSVGIMGGLILCIFLG